MSDYHREAIGVARSKPAVQPHEQEQGLRDTVGARVPEQRFRPSLVFEEAEERVEPPIPIELPEVVRRPVHLGRPDDRDLRLDPVDRRPWPVLIPVVENHADRPAEGGDRRLAHRCEQRGLLRRGRRRDLCHDLHVAGTFHAGNAGLCSSPEHVAPGRVDDQRSRSMAPGCTMARRRRTRSASLARSAGRSDASQKRMS